MGAWDGQQGGLPVALDWAIEGGWSRGIYTYSDNIVRDTNNDIHRPRAGGIRPSSCHLLPSPSATKDCKSGPTSRLREADLPYTYPYILSQMQIC